MRNNQIDHFVFLTLGHLINIPSNARWKQNGVTVAGGNGEGDRLNQFDSPNSLYVDDDQTIYVVDSLNHRIVKWKSGATSGEVVAGGNGEGNELNELDSPTDMIVDKKTNNLIICDWGNRRVMKWSRRSGTTNGEILIDNVKCWGLAIDDEGFLYVSDEKKYEVKRYKMGETQGTVVAGGNGLGNHLNQLKFQLYITVDRNQSVYVSDYANSRVMKWEKGAKEGIIVADTGRQRNAPIQLSYPNGVFVDQLGTIYVTDERKDRVMRWRKGIIQGEMIIGGNGKGNQANQLNKPEGLALDRYGNLYVVDSENQRVQRFSIE